VQAGGKCLRNAVTSALHHIQRHKNHNHTHHTNQNTNKTPLKTKVPFLGAVVNKVPRRDHAIMAAQLRRRFAEGGVPLLGVIPEVCPFVRLAFMC
jgi:hypothetical protein